MRIPVALAAFLLFYTCAFSQNRTENFEIALPEQKVQNSRYRSIQFIDSRYDTSSLGIVQLGAFNKKAKVVSKTPFSTQLTNVLNAFVDETAKQGELVFQLRQFSFAEITGAMSEKGYCFLRAVLYVNEKGRYQKLGAIDTVILVRSMDVTRSLFRNGSKTITGFIGSHLLKEASSPDYYSYNDILNLDEIEKRKIKLYTVESYSDGVYASYQSFMEQVPDKQVEAEIKGNKLTHVTTVDDNGKKQKVKSKEVYAVVYNGQPFVATAYGFYPLKKINNDFFFTGKAKATANGGDVLAASFFFGVVGGLIASNAEATFEMKIDYMNGGFIRLREIKASSLP